MLYLFNHFPDEHLLIVKKLQLLVDSVGHQLVQAVSVEALEAEKVGDDDRIQVTTGMRSIKSVCLRIVNVLRIGRFIDLNCF
jgi:hypothetical protein